VLANDTDVDSVANGETKTVVGVAAGAVGTTALQWVGADVIGAYGTINIAADGTYTYTVDNTNTAVQALRVSGQTLTDVFTYTMVDAAGLPMTGTVTINITGSNDAPVAIADQGFAIESGGVFNSTSGSNASGNVLINDTDVDGGINGETKVVTGVAAGNAMSVSGSVGIAVAGSYGTITLNSDGSYSYWVDDSNPDVQSLRTSGQTLHDSFSYTVTDAAGLSDTNQLTITIRGRNDNPIANLDFGTAFESGGDLNGTLGSNAVGDVLANDTDADSASDGETKEVAGVVSGVALSATGSVGVGVQGMYGTILIDSHGSYIYVIDENNLDVQRLRLVSETLTDVFTYTVIDAGGLTDTSQVAITLRGANDAPFAITSTGLVIDENSPNDSIVGSFAMQDVDLGETALYQLVDDASGRFSIDAATGVLVIADSMRLDFEASSQHTIVVRATDAGGLSIDSAFVVQVLNVNEKPVGGSDLYVTTYIDRVIESRPGVVGNDSDPEQDAMIARLVSGPQTGVLIFNSDGSFVYQPDGAYVGTVSFVYRLSDGILDSDPVTVEIVIGLPKTLPGTTLSSSSNASTTDSSSGSTKESSTSSKEQGASSNSSVVNSSAGAAGAVARSPEIGSGIAGVGAADASVPQVNAGGDRNPGNENSVRDQEKVSISDGALLVGLLSGTEARLLSETVRFDYTQLDQHRMRNNEEGRERFGSDFGLNRTNGGEGRRNDASGSIELNTTAVVQTVLGTGVVLWLAQGFQVAATMVTAAPVWTGLDPVALTMGVDGKGERKSHLAAEEKMFDK
ncbi:MAG: VCBS domain-containing protein, partial [Pirellula sp.]